MDKKTIQRKARAAAKRMCSRGCVAGYDSCNKRQRSKEKAVELLGEDHGCPLAKYDVPDAPLSFPDEVIFLLKEDGPFWVCANCKDGGLIVGDAGMAITFPNWDRVCLDCPVQVYQSIIMDLKGEKAYT